MSDPDTDAHISLDHQQVLAFTLAYLRDYDCLPTTREVALACGFGSSHTAARIIADLEEQGVICRDRRFQRLGTVSPRWVVSSISTQEQLWWCERDCIEYQAALEATRIGLELAPNLDATASLHAEGLSRVVVLRALDDARRRLGEGGATVSAAGQQALEEQRDVARAANELLTDWVAYCAVRLIWTLSAHDGLGRVRPLTLGYLGAGLVAARRSTESLLPTYWAQVHFGPDDVGPDPVLMNRLTELLSALRRGRARHCPSHSERPEVDARDLLAGAR